VFLGRTNLDRTAAVGQGGRSVGSRSRSPRATGPLNVSAKLQRRVQHEREHLLGERTPRRTVPRAELPPTLGRDSRHAPGEFESWRDAASPVHRRRTVTSTMPAAGQSGPHASHRRFASLGKKASPEHSAPSPRAVTPLSDASSDEEDVHGVTYRSHRPRDSADVNRISENGLFLGSVQSVVADRRGVVRRRATPRRSDPTAATQSALQAPTSSGTESKADTSSLTAPLSNDPRLILRGVRRHLTDVAFARVCSEFEMTDRERSGRVGWAQFASVVTRLVPQSRLKNVAEVTKLLNSVGMALTEGRQVNFLEFFDRVSPSPAEAERVASGHMTVEEMAGSEAFLSKLEEWSKGSPPIVSDTGSTPLREREEAVRRRLRMLANHPVRLSPVEVLRLLRDRAMKGSALRAFRAIDSDGNGVLDAKEFRMALRRLRIDLSAEDAEELIRTIDVNGDGVIQWEEWADFVADFQKEEVAKQSLGGAGEGGAAKKHNPPPPGARADGNRRGLIRADTTVRALERLFQHHPEVLASFPVDFSACRALLRRLDKAATSFVSVEDFERYLLRETTRRLKPGVTSNIGSDLTNASLFQAVLLPDVHKDTLKSTDPQESPLESFPVKAPVREAVGLLAGLCDTNEDGWIQLDDLEELSKVLSERTTFGLASPRLATPRVAAQHTSVSDVEQDLDARRHLLEGTAVAHDVWVVEPDFALPVDHQQQPPPSPAVPTLDLSKLTSRDRTLRDKAFSVRSRASRPSARSHPVRAGHRTVRVMRAGVTAGLSTGCDFASQAQVASARNSELLRCVAKARASPRFDPSEATSFRALEARGAVLPSSRLGAKRMQLSRDTNPLRGGSDPHDEAGSRFETVSAREAVAG
jgi:hypothetical protein